MSILWEVLRWVFYAWLGISAIGFFCMVIEGVLFQFIQQDIHRWRTRGFFVSDLLAMLIILPAHILAWMIYALYLMRKTPLYLLPDVRRKKSKEDV